MTMLTIAVLLPRRSGGGAEFVAMQWTDHLRGLGHQVEVITTHEPPGITEPGVVALSAPSFAGRVRALRALLADRRYDVLLALMPHWNVLALLASAGLRDRPAVLISGRNIETTLLASQGSSFRVELALSRLLYRRADGYIAISHPVAAEATSRYRLPMDRIWVVPNPATAKLGDPRRRPTAQETGQGPPTVTLTVPARLVRQKQPEVAVETAALLRSAYGIDAGVDYFGTGPEADVIRATAVRLDVRVRFRGWVTAWFEEAAPDAVVLLPSVAEGFANVLVEAAAAGIPSVTSSRALGVADAIVPEVTGIFAMDTRPESLAAAVDRARHLTPADAGAWFGRFSPEHSGAKLIDVISAVTGRPVEDLDPARGRSPSHHGPAVRGASPTDQWST